MKIIKRLKEVVYQAQKRIDIDAAQNPELQRAIHIVETFLRNSGRVCYGGQAINAQLPKKDQFYNMETSLPDYDFFSPDINDADMLIHDLKAAGFNEISKRIGIHEGTTKIYVNYTPIADITLIDGDFYEQIHRRSTIIDGIHYSDPVFLRMLMFLELSRPRGMVARWEKVYERLMLLDRAHPLKTCKGNATMVESKEAAAARPAVLRFIIKNHRVFMGSDIHAMYKSSGSGRSAKSRTSFLLNGKVPLVFLSPDAELDSNVLAQELQAKKEPITGYQGTLPAMVALYHDDKLVCLVVQQEACHSFITVPLTKQRQLRIASLDTLLTFFIGLYYRDELLMSSESLLCWIRQYIDLSVRYRSKPTKLVPAFPLECSGYETTFASLLRAKGARIEAARQRIGSGERQTRRNMNSRIRQTRKLY
jgi:hypothetical protein